MIKRLLPMALAGLTLPALATPVAAITDADPAVWVAADKDTTIYLFGTIHALDGKQPWFDDEVRAAFDRSDELVLEIIPPDVSSLQPIIGKYIFDTSGRTLTSKLSPQGRERLADALARAGLPATALDRYKPFFASITLTTLTFQKMGYSSDTGAEKILQKAATSAGKKVGALETIDYQLSLFDRLSEAEQLKLLESSLQEGDSMPAEIAGLVAAWAKGDAKRVAALLNQTDLESPALYQLLLVDRNKSWAEWIDRRLDQPGTVFLAVGAGHLSGKDSVQKLLKKRGIRSRRMRPGRH
jgi:uncharacterized protein